MGLPFYDTSDNLQMLPFVLEFSPDVVIYYGGFNDVCDSGLKRLQVGENPVAKALTLVLDHSLFFWKASRRVMLALTGKTPEELATVDYKLKFSPDVVNGRAREFLVDPFMDNLIEMAYELNSQGVPLVVVSQLKAPVGVQWLGVHAEEEFPAAQYEGYYDSFLAATNAALCDEYISRTLREGSDLNTIELCQYFQSELRDRMPDLAKRPGVFTHDFVGEVNGDLTLLVTYVHLSPEGTRILGESVCQFLRDHWGELIGNR